MEKTQTAYRLLELLSDGKFHSGEALGPILGITRSAVWKAVKQLINLGIGVESLAGKGYRIPHGIELLDSAQIQTALDPSTKAHVHDFIVFTRINSTNDYLLSAMPNNPDKNVVCLAEYQTQGRGRRGRRWVAPFGTNLYLSLLWHFQKDPAEIVGLSLAVAVAVVNALQQYGIKKGLGLKWPNDVLWKGRKLAGILLEMMAEHHEHSAVVIGIGLNTHMPSTAGSEIDQPWTDIHEITHAKPKRNQLAGLIIQHVVQSLLLFQEQGLTPFLPTWRAFDRLIGKTVKLEISSRTIEGVMQDVSDKGELILLCANNEEKRFYSGELSVRVVNTQ